MAKIVAVCISEKKGAILKSHWLTSTVPTTPYSSASTATGSRRSPSSALSTGARFRDLHSQPVL